MVTTCPYNLNYWLSLPLVLTRTIHHNKVLDFVWLDNYKTDLQSFQLHWSLDHYKTALDGVSVIFEGLVATRDHCIYGWHQNCGGWSQMVWAWGQGIHTHPAHTSIPEQRWRKMQSSKCVDQYSKWEGQGTRSNPAKMTLTPSSVVL